MLHVLYVYEIGSKFTSYGYWYTRLDSNQRPIAYKTTTLTRLSYGCVVFGIGIPEWIRTTGLDLRRVALYPAELRRH